MWLTKGFCRSADITSIDFKKVISSSVIVLTLFFSFSQCYYTRVQHCSSYLIGNSSCFLLFLLVSSLFHFSIFTSPRRAGGLHGLQDWSPALPNSSTGLGRLGAIVDWTDWPFANTAILIPTRSRRKSHEIGPRIEGTN